jgi:hypothetical protein
MNFVNAIQRCGSGYGSCIVFSRINPDPDLDGQKCPTKKEKSEVKYRFEVLDVLFRELL